MFGTQQAPQSDTRGLNFLTNLLLPPKPYVYNPYDSPPNFKVAIRHGLAKRVYCPKTQNSEQGTSNYVCPCCGFPSKGKMIPLQANLSELYHLGSGYALYFKTMKYSIALLIVMFSISGLFNLISNAITEDCTPVSLANDVPFYCLQNYISTFTISNKKDDPQLLTVQMILNLISVILLIPCFQYIRYQLRKTDIDADDTTVTPADYTVKVTGVDPNTTDNEIKEWIENFGTNDKPIVCCKINRTYNIEEYIALKKKIDIVETTRIKEESNPDKIKALEQESMRLKEQLNELKARGLTRTHTVFLTFEKAAHTADVLEYFEKSLKWSWKNFVEKSLLKSFSELNGRKVYIERAPEPTDILWENLHEKPWEAFKKRTATNIAAALLITICFCLIILVNWAQGKIIDGSSQGSRLPQILSIVGSVLIYLINTLLSFAIRYLVAKEEHGSYTSYLAGTCTKLYVAQLINTGFTTILAKIALENSFDQSNNLKDGIEQVNFYGKQGLLENMFYVFISNAFLTPVMGILDPFYFLKLYQRSKAKTTKMTQQEAHALYEQPEMDLAIKNALLLKTMLLTAFFAPAIPFAFIFSVLGLIANYWVDKYLLLRRNVYPKAIKSELCSDIVQQLEWMTFVFGIGNLFFVVTLEGNDGIQIYDVVPKAIVFTIIGLGLFIGLSPSNFLNKRIFKIVDDVTEDDTYDVARLGFPTDYAIQNPVTSQEGLEDFLKLVRSKKASGSKMKKDPQIVMDRATKIFAAMGVQIKEPDSNLQDNGTTKEETKFSQLLLPSLQELHRKKEEDFSQIPKAVERLDTDEDKENSIM